jgi:hypothetical protein
MVSKHDKVLTRLMLCPQLLGIENVVFRNTGTIWTPEGGGTVRLETDLMFYTGNHYELPYHLVEYKANINDEQKAIRQLCTGRQLIKQFFGMESYLYFVFSQENKLVMKQYGRKRRKRYEKNIRGRKLFKH